MPAVVLWSQTTSASAPPGIPHWSDDSKRRTACGRTRQPPCPSAPAYERRADTRTRVRLHLPPSGARSCARRGTADRRAHRCARDDGDMREIVITTEVIRLGQFLKLADVVELGSDVKSVLAEGGVRVN